MSGTSIPHIERLRRGVVHDLLAKAEAETGIANNALSPMDRDLNYSRELAAARFYERCAEAVRNV